MNKIIFGMLLCLSFAYGKSFVDIAPLEINLLSETGNRQLSVGISLACENETNSKEINKVIPIVKDSIIRVMSSKTFEEISTLKGKEKVSDELTKIINKNIGANLVQSVHFTEFHLKNNLDALIRYIRQIEARCL